MIRQGEITAIDVPNHRATVDLQGTSVVLPVMSDVRLKTGITAWVYDMGNGRMIVMGTGDADWSDAEGPEGTDLTYNTGTRTVESSTGTNATIGAASSSFPGFYGLVTGAQVGDIEDNVDRIAEIDEMFEYAGYRPGGNTDATTGTSFADWVTISGLTVPTWATYAEIACHITGIYDVTAANNLYDFRCVFDGENELTSYRAMRGVGINIRFGLSFIARFDDLTSGAADFKIQMDRVSGSGVIRASTVAVFELSARYAATAP